MKIYKGNKLNSRLLEVDAVQIRVHVVTKVDITTMQRDHYMAW